MECLGIRSQYTPSLHWRQDILSASIDYPKEPYSTLSSVYCSTSIEDTRLVKCFVSKSISTFAKFSGKDRFRCKIFKTIPGLFQFFSPASYSLLQPENDAINYDPYKSLCKKVKSKQSKVKAKAS